MEVIEPIVQKKRVQIKHQPSKIIAQPILKFWIRMRIIYQLFLTARKELGSIKKALDVLQVLRAKYRTLFKAPMYHKITKIDGRYFWRIAAPGYPSQALKNAQASEIQRIHSPGKQPPLRLLMLSVTSKCPLHCQHCYEWNNLNQREALSKEDLMQVVKSYQQHGTSIFFLGGGEPMLRLDDICHLIKHAKSTSEFWIYTSGFHLGKEQALQLKQAGLTGIIVSLDDYRPNKHDAFRGFSGAFENAIYAVYACHEARLGTALALCATTTFVTEHNIQKYMALAKTLGVHFVQFLEPKAAGRFSGKEVLLSKAKQQLLEKWTHAYNHNSTYRDYPIINYPESVTRKIGCISGDRMIYVNSAGQIQQCPFCDSTLGNVLDYSVDEVLAEMRRMPCADYAKSKL
jgi:MoaA/NifB/PqqE/SkfB family radical SAM enzyme